MNEISDLICFSHLRWGFIYQRPNHLIGRFARRRRAFFFEEPVFDAARPDLEVREIPVDAGGAAPPGTLHVAVPHLRAGVPAEVASVQQAGLLHSMVRTFAIERPALWFYTPMALSFACGLPGLVTVYDCMDELSAFKGAPPAMLGMEEELLARADVVFAGGRSLFEHKRTRHPNVHVFPSSVDVDHFVRARGGLSDPPDQQRLPRPRVGYFGAIDERIDLEIVDHLARALPDWQVVMIGPVVKIDPRTLPKRPNVHYLGLKTYDMLPAYLGGWDVAMMPFALNDATRFISPTKTLEYLAGGRPVVSTAVPDVVHPYGDQGIVTIADRASFPAAVVAARHSVQCERATAVLSEASWDMTAGRMWYLVERACHGRLHTHGFGAQDCSTI